MSKLYDVISRLEEVTAEGSSPINVTGSMHGSTASIALNQGPLRKESSPLTRILIMAGVAILLGLAAVTTVFWWKNVSFQQIAENAPAKNVSAAAVRPLSPAADMSAVDKPLEKERIIPPEETPALPVKQTEPGHSSQTVPGEFRETAITAGDEHVVVPNIETSGVDSGQGLERDFQIPSIGKLPAAEKNTSIKINEIQTFGGNEKGEEPQAVSRLAPAVSPALTAARAARWLHQAEAYRHQGDWESAIALYQRVFATTKSPDVANNLAAALIEAHRLQEARDLLVEAARIDPDDPDIRQNLSVIKQRLGKR